MATTICPWRRSPASAGSHAWRAWLLVSLAGCFARPAAASASAEPKLAPTPYLALDATRPGLHLQLNFPPAANAGPQRDVYWLTGSEPLLVDVQLGAGPGEIPLPYDIVGVFVVDGVQVPVEVEGHGPRRALALSLTRRGVVERVRLRVPGRLISAGVHVASLLLWRRDGLPYPSLSFTIRKDAANDAPPLESAGFARQPGAGAPALSVQHGPSRQPLLAARVELGPSPLALRLVAERDPADGFDRILPVTFLGFVEGRQIPLGRLGLHPRLLLRPGERALADIQLAIPPRPAGPRTLVIFALAEAGGQALPPRCIGWSVLAPPTAPA